MFGQDIYSQSQGFASRRVVDATIHSFIQPEYFLDLSTTQNFYHQSICDVDAESDEFKFPQIEFYQNNSNQKIQEINTKRQKSSDLKIEKKKKKSNNAFCYILKHCIKTMLSNKKKEQMMNLCTDLKSNYQEFRYFWLNILKEFNQNHLGINKLIFILQKENPFNHIFKIFTFVYIKFQYLSYLIRSKVNNKEMYIDCMIQFSYFCQASSTLSYKYVKILQSKRDI